MYRILKKLFLMFVCLIPLSSLHGTQPVGVDNFMKQASNLFGQIQDTAYKASKAFYEKQIELQEAVEKRFFSDREAVIAEIAEKKAAKDNNLQTLTHVRLELSDNDREKIRLESRKQNTVDVDRAIARLKDREQALVKRDLELDKELIELKDTLNHAQDGLKAAEQATIGATKQAADFLKKVAFGDKEAQEAERLKAIEEKLKNDADKAVRIANHDKTLQAEKERLERLLAFIKDPESIKPVFKYTSLATISVIGGYFTIKKGVEIGGNYLDSLIGKPKLIRESNMEFSLLTQLKYQLFGKKNKFSKLENIIVNPEVEKQLKSIALGARKSSEKKIPFVHVILQGPPGVGKTMFAKALAEYAGFNYLILSGADARQFKDEVALAELNKLFDRIENTYGQFVVFVDEADAMLPQRTPELSEAKTNIVTTFLSRVEKQTSNKYLVVLATNYPERLDKAVRSRFGGEMVMFPLPTVEEREKIFELYLNQYFKPKKLNIDDEVLAHKRDLAKSMEGLTGRDLEGLVVKMMRDMILNDQKSLNMDIAKATIQRTIAGLNAIKDLEVKASSAPAA